jgi:hypothetical protein
MLILVLACLAAAVGCWIGYWLKEICDRRGGCRRALALRAALLGRQHAEQQRERLAKDLDDLVAAYDERGEQLKRTEALLAETRRRIVLIKEAIVD